MLKRIINLILLIVCFSIVSCKKTEYKVRNIGGGGGGNNTSELVAVNSATKLIFAVPPVNALAATVMNHGIQVHVLDENNNLVSDSNAQITLSFGTDPSNGASTLSGTLTKRATNGVVIFNDISVDKAFSGYTLQASSASLESATSSVFEISVGPLVGLSFRVVPTQSVVNFPLNPEVVVNAVDAGGNTIVTFEDDITIALANNTVAATLTGTLTVSAVNGVATFTDLTLDKLADDFTLEATAVGLSNATSPQFKVMNPYKVSAGFIHTCVKTDASNKCFGQNEVFELGNGNNIHTNYMDNPAPTDVLNDQGEVASDIVEMLIAPYYDTICSRLVNNEVRCMGRGASGQRGDGTTINEPLPNYVEISEGVRLQNISKLSVGNQRTCAISENNLYCMGDNKYPEHVMSGNVCPGFADEATCNSKVFCKWNDSIINASKCRDNTTVTRAVLLTSNVVDVTSGYNHICILDNTNKVKCWGENTNGQLGSGGTTSINNGVIGATDVVGLEGDTVVEIQSGGEITCARLADNTVKCWGRGIYGHMGQGNKNNQLSAVHVLNADGSAPLSNITQMAIGDQHSCFVTNARELYCVGNNIEKEIAGVDEDTSLVVKHPTLTNIIQASVGIDHTCVVDTANKVYCWGDNSSGQLGVAGEDSSDPVLVQGL